MHCRARALLLTRVCVCCLARSVVVTVVNLRHDTAGDLRISLRSPSAADAVFLFNNNVRVRLSMRWDAPRALVSACRATARAPDAHHPRSAASPTWNPTTSP
jgi:hypothetical protein